LVTYNSAAVPAASVEIWPRLSIADSPLVPAREAAVIQADPEWMAPSERLPAVAPCDAERVARLISVVSRG
jgi:hypothetical protein